MLQMGEERNGREGNEPEVGYHPNRLNIWGTTGQEHRSGRAAPLANVLASKVGYVTSEQVFARSQRVLAVA